MNAHLLRKQKRGRLAEYHGTGAHVVEAFRYSPAEQAIHINKTRHFAPEPEEVWNFHIGGYQVIDKYLKSHKGRDLNLDEIDFRHLRDGEGEGICNRTHVVERRTSRRFQHN